MRYRAEELFYERIKLFGKEGLFAEDRVLGNSVPEGFVRYEVRHDDEGLGEPVEAARGILVNFLGTLLLEEKLEQVEKEGYCLIEETDWEYIGERSCTLEEYRKKRNNKMKE